MLIYLTVETYPSSRPDVPGGARIGVYTLRAWESGGWPTPQTVYVFVRCKMPEYLRLKMPEPALPGNVSTEWEINLARSIVHRYSKELGVHYRQIIRCHEAANEHPTELELLASAHLEIG